MSKRSVTMLCSTKSAGRIRKARDATRRSAAPTLSGSSKGPPWHNTMMSLRTLRPALPVVIGATIGSFAESAMGATLEGAGFVNNDVLNFLNTAIAAAAALALAKVI